MRELIVGLIVFGLVCSSNAQNWQDEEHVWNEEKGEWEVRNKAHGRIDEKPGNDRVTVRPFAGQPWERYLSKSVKYGKREPTQWELEEAQRKLWAKQVRIQRSMQEAERRRQVIAHRKATGWYAARRNAGLQHGAGAYNMFHQQANVGNKYYSSCHLRRSQRSNPPTKPYYKGGYKNDYPVDPQKMKYIAESLLMLNNANQDKTGGLKNSYR